MPRNARARQRAHGQSHLAARLQADLPGRAPVDLTQVQQQLINIRVAPVRRQPTSATLRPVGIIAPDETRVADLNSRIMGWVERLYVDKPGQFVEVFVNAPVEICEQRDPKGLYAKARANEIKEFTGISAPYEAPENAEIELRTDKLTVPESVARIIDYLNVSADEVDVSI